MFPSRLLANGHRRSLLANYYSLVTFYYEKIKQKKKKAIRAVLMPSLEKKKDLNSLDKTPFFKLDMSLPLSLPDWNC